MKASHLDLASHQKIRQVTWKVQLLQRSQAQKPCLQGHLRLRGELQRENYAFTRSSFHCTVALISVSVIFTVTVAGRKFFISYIISRVDSVESVQLDFKDAWKIQCSSFVEQTMLEWSPSNRVITFSPGVSQVSHNFFHIILMMLRESSFPYHLNRHEQLSW